MPPVTTEAKLPPSPSARRAKAELGPRSGDRMLVVGSFVARLTRKAFSRYGFSGSGLVTDWSAIAGRELARYTRPERLRWPREESSGETPVQLEGARRRRGATLVLRVEGARALDVQFRAPQIIERINAYFGYAAVGELRILQAPLEDHAAADLAAAIAARAGSGGDHQRAPQEGDCGEDLAGIGDLALRDALFRLGAGVRACARGQIAASRR